MINAFDIPFLLAVIAAAAFITGIFFFSLRALKTSPKSSAIIAAVAFPTMLIAIIFYVEIWNPDPHGFVMAGLGFLAFVSLPITVLTAIFLARRSA